MKSWTKVLVGCGGLGCLAAAGLVALVLVLPEPTPEQRAQWEAERLQQQEQRREREEQAQREEQERVQRELEERLERAARAGKEARARFFASFLESDGGGFVSLTQHVFGVHYNHQDSSLGEGKLFPAPSPVEWEAVQIIAASDGTRYAIYRHRGRDLDTRFAARLPGSTLPLLGTWPESGCYRYLGLMEGKGRHGIVPFMAFERETYDDPLCTGRQ